MNACLGTIRFIYYVSKELGGPKKGQKHADVIYGWYQGFSIMFCKVIMRGFYFSTGIQIT